MKSRYVSYLFLCALLFIACAGTSPSSRDQPDDRTNPEETRSATFPQGQGRSSGANGMDFPELDRLRGHAEALRSQASDLGLREILPADFVAIDGLLLKGADNYGIDDALSSEAYANASRGYQEILDNGLPLLASKWRKMARALMIAAGSDGAETLFPRLFASQAASFSNAANLESCHAFEIAIDAYTMTCRLADILIKLRDASETRRSIIKRDLAKWDTSNWTLAERKFAESQQSFGIDNAGSMEAAEEATMRYCQVMDAAPDHGGSDKE